MPEKLERYKLQVNLVITKEVGNQYGESGNEETISWSNSGMGDRLSINEDINLGGLDFIGAMGVLGKMHEAMNSIRDNKGIRNG